MDKLALIVLERDSQIESLRRRFIVGGTLREYSNPDRIAAASLVQRLDR
jgi:hypothetical protein